MHASICRERHVAAHVQMADGAPVTAARVRWLFEQVKRQATEWGALRQDPRYTNKKLTFGSVCPVGYGHILRDPVKDRGLVFEPDWGRIPGALSLRAADDAAQLLEFIPENPTAALLQAAHCLLYTSPSPRD